MGKMFGATQPVTSNQSRTTPSDVASNQTSSSDFQILSPPPSTSQINGSPDYHPSQLPDLHLCISSANFDLSPDEIQNKLRNILKENLELKETLHENNVAMSEQFDRLSAWQREVKAVQEQQKIRFEETKSLIEKLYAENVELRKELETTKEKHQITSVIPEEFLAMQKKYKAIEDKLLITEKELERLTIINLQMKEELDTTTETLERVKVNRNHLIVEKQELLASNNSLQAHLADLQEQMSELGASGLSEKSQPSFVVVNSAPKERAENQDRASSGIRELLLQLHSEQEKSSALMAELMEERKLKSQVMVELNTLKQNTMSPPLISKVAVENFERKGAKIEKEMKESEMKFTQASNNVHGYKDQCGRLEDRLSEYEDRLRSLKTKDDVLIVQLRSEIDDLKCVLAREQANNREDKKNLNAAHSQFENLLQDYQQLLRSWEKYEQEQANKDVQSIAYYEIQVKSLKEEIDRLTAQLVANEETVAAKIDETNRLRAQMKASMAELNKIPILQAQVEVYQTDFRMEREAREKLYQEKSRAIKELGEMESKYQQLREELDMHRRKRFQEIREQGRRATGHQARNYFGSISPTSSSSFVSENFNIVEPPQGLNRVPPVIGRKTEVATQWSSAPANRAMASQEPQQYICPKCNLSFTDLQPLENHVNQCLDNDLVLFN